MGMNEIAQMLISNCGEAALAADAISKRVLGH
jgi:hypothetical protein